MSASSSMVLRIQEEILGMAPKTAKSSSTMSQCQHVVWHGVGDILDLCISMVFFVPSWTLNIERVGYMFGGVSVLEKGIEKST